MFFIFILIYKKQNKNLWENCNFLLIVQKFFLNLNRSLVIYFFLLINFNTKLISIDGKNGKGHNCLFTQRIFKINFGISCLIYFLIDYLIK